MHLLIQQLPSTVTIDTIEYDIDTSYTNMLLFEEIIFSKDIPTNLKDGIALKNFYKGTIPHDPIKAMDKLVWFYALGEDTKKGDTGTVKTDKPVFSFKYDAMYIYSAFKTQYNIDLFENKTLHWWKFMSLFNSLTEEHKISKIMGYRAVDLREVKDKRQRNFYKQMKALYKLPTEEKEKVKKKTTLSDEEIANAFL